MVTVSIKKGMNIFRSGKQDIQIQFMKKFNNKYILTSASFFEEKGCENGKVKIEKG